MDEEPARHEPLLPSPKVQSLSSPAPSDGHRPEGLQGPSDPSSWLEAHDGRLELRAAPPDGEAIGVLAEAVRRSPEGPPGGSVADWLGLDPEGAHDWSLLEGVRRAQQDPASADEAEALERPDLLVLAAVAVATSTATHDALSAARRLARRAGLGRADEQEVLVLVGERNLLRAAARSRDAHADTRVLQLAAHVETPERARALYLLGLAMETDDATTVRLHGLHDLLQERLTATDAPGVGGVADGCRARAKALASPQAAERIDHAPAPYLLATDAATVAAHAELAHALSYRERLRVRVAEDDQPWHWRVDVAAEDREALLAAVTLALHESGCEIVSALVATWSDGVAIESFRVKSRGVPMMGTLHDAIAERLEQSFTSQPIEEAAADFDHESNPWFTVCHLEVPDRPGLLHALAVDLASVGARIHAAEVSTAGGLAVDRFELSDRRGDKLSPTTCEQVVAAIARGATVPQRRRGLRSALRGRRGSTSR